MLSKQVLSHLVKVSIDDKQAEKTRDTARTVRIPEIFTSYSPATVSR